MNKISLYKLNGKLDKTLVLNNDNIRGINGMKLRCHLKDGTYIIGFADVFRTYDKNEFDGEIHDYINLWTYDNLDEETHSLIGDKEKYDQTFVKVMLDDIIDIEAILHSNPRWGSRLTNKFQFFSTNKDSNGKFKD